MKAVSKLWKTEQVDAAIHVHPLNDEETHDLETTRCKCLPRVEWKDEQTGKLHDLPIVVHRAFDCRELVEEAVEIKRGVEKELRK